MCFILRDLAVNKLEFPLAVVAHDAGAANLILGWIKPFVGKEEIRFSLSGPALKIFSENIPPVVQHSVEEALKGARMLLSGTSSIQTVLEHTARKHAHASHIPSIGVLDHWVNYKERFVRSNECILPDALWVSDTYALTLAEREFPGTPVFCHPNYFLDAAVAEVQRFTQDPHSTLRILYILEPISLSWGTSEKAPEFQALDYFMDSLAALSSTEFEIRLRPHPSESPQKYSEWIKKQHLVSISLDAGTLPHAIGWSDWVMGCESYALFVALKAGKRVISTLPPWAPPCRLPIQIEHLRDLISPSI